MLAPADLRRLQLGSARSGLVGAQAVPSVLKALLEGHFKQGLLGWIPKKLLRLSPQGPVGLPTFQPGPLALFFHLQSGGVPSWMKNLPH